MIVINLQGEVAPVVADACQYMATNQILLIDRQVNALSPHCLKSQWEVNWPPTLVFEDRTAFSNRRVTSWVAGSWREVTCQIIEGRGYRIVVEGVGTFAVQEDGSAITLEKPHIDQPNQQVIDETLLGTPLVIALAAKGIFCLHASALLARGHAFAFLGDSGAGKSTLSAYLSGLTDGLQRLADDVLPVTAEQDRVVVLPRFPQLKLSAEEQVGPNIPERIPLGGVYLLDVPAEPVSPASILLDRRTAAATLIRHTMATSLFGERLLGPHMDMCANIAAHIPVNRLIYPHDRESLPEIAQMLAGSMGRTA